MIKLAFNKAKPNLVYAIDGTIREPINGGIVEYYIGTLKDTSTVPDTETTNYKVQVMAFEQKWSEVPVDVSGTGNVNNQSKTVDPAITKSTIKPDTGYTGLDKVTVNAVTAAIDSNISAGNIKSGVTILGVNGAVTELVGETAQVTPTTSAQTVTPITGNGLTSVEVSAVTSSIDANIVAGNIKSGVTILGVAGSYTGSTLPADEIGVYLNINSSSTEEIDLLQAIDYTVVEGVFGLQSTIDPIPVVFIGTNLTVVSHIEMTSETTCIITTDLSSYTGEIETDPDTGDNSWVVIEVV